jgi:hypothetical protein
MMQEENKTKSDSQNGAPDLPLVRCLRFRVLAPADLDEELSEHIIHMFQNTLNDIRLSRAEHEQIEDIHMTLEHAWEAPEIELV